MGLFILRLVTGGLVSFFAAREMANRSDIIFKTLEYFSIGAPDIVKVFVGCMIMILGAMLVIGFWTRFISLALLILLSIGGYCWLPQASQLHFQIEALYGVLLFYLLLVGGGPWAVTRKRSIHGQSVLESEQSILPKDKRPSIFKGQGEGESTLVPPKTVVGPDLSDEDDYGTIDDEDEDDEEEDGDESPRSSL